MYNATLRFVPHFARLDATPHAITLKDRSMNFGSLNKNYLKFMNLVRIALISLPVLTLPNTTSHITLDADVFDVQIACVLPVKKPDSAARPGGYWTRSRTNVKVKHDTMERKCLSAACAIPLLRSIWKEYGSLFVQTRTYWSELKTSQTLPEDLHVGVCKFLNLTSTSFTTQA